MNKHRSNLQVYADTSVFGGCYDKECATHSGSFMDVARGGRITLLISQIVVDELRDAPARVQDVLKSVPATRIEFVELTPEVTGLRDAYLEAGIVGRKWIDDATHVVAASVIGADAIVSWNFKHIVRVDRIGRYNAINVARGYRPITIVTPLEVVREDKEKD